MRELLAARGLGPMLQTGSPKSGVKNENRNIFLLRNNPGKPGPEISPMTKWRGPDSAPKLGTNQWRKPSRIPRSFILSLVRWNQRDGVDADIRRTREIHLAPLRDGVPHHNKNLTHAETINFPGCFRSVPATRSNLQPIPTRFGLELAMKCAIRLHNAQRFPWKRLIGLADGNGAHLNLCPKERGSSRDANSG